MGKKVGWTTKTPSGLIKTTILSPEGGDPSQPRPTAWVTIPIHFNACAPKGAIQWLALSGLAAATAVCFS